MSDAKTPLNTLKVLQVTLHATTLFLHARTRVEEREDAIVSLPSLALFLCSYSRHQASPCRHQRVISGRRSSNHNLICENRGDL